MFWRSSLLLMAIPWPGCAYVTKAEFLEYWDADGDGFPLDEDCAPDDPTIFPGAADVRGDGCDTDCGAESDLDGDDWPDVTDCGPQNDTFYPCSPFEEPGDGADHDCDGLDTVRLDLCDGRDPDFPEALPCLAPDTDTGDSTL